MATDCNLIAGDFGVVSVTPAADSNVEEAGVVLFWSPELVQRKIVNRKIDIWALGIVILEILNGGRAPYEDEQLDEEEVNFYKLAFTRNCVKFFSPRVDKATYS